MMPSLRDRVFHPHPHFKQVPNDPRDLAVYTTGKSGLDDLHRRDMHQLRRQRLRRHFTSHGRLPKQQLVVFARAPNPQVGNQLCIKTARLPKATYDEERNTALCSRQEYHPLDIKTVPVSLMFGVFDSYVHTLHLTPVPSPCSHPSSSAPMSS